MQSYRPLTEAEIKALIHNGCTSTNWKDISVKEDFLRTI